MTMTTLPITLCDNYARIGSAGGSAGGEAPVCTVNPSNATVTAGAQATFTATFTGTPVIHYTWKKNHAIIAGAPDSNSYTTPATALSDNGNLYQVLGTNAYGSALSLDATLTVNAATNAPTITTHPINKSVNVGDTVTFVVTASGAPTLTYQWYKAPDAVTAGAPISGATSSSYAISSAQVSDNGFYYCTVTNGYGSATSNRGQLTVTAASGNVFITIATPTNLSMVGEPFTMTITAPGAASAEPTLVAYEGEVKYLSSSYNPPSSYSTGTNGTVVQSLPFGAAKVAEFIKFYGFVDPGYVAAPTLHVRVAACTIPGNNATDYIKIHIYYGSTFITTLKSYIGSTIAGQTFPQDLTATLNTTGGYPTYALMMAALNIQVELYTDYPVFGQNLITFNYFGFEVIG